MARATKKETSRADELWEEYRRIQLTPEEKAAAHAELERIAAQAAASGVYRDLQSLFGKVHLEYDIDQLREDRD